MMRVLENWSFGKKYFFRHPLMKIGNFTYSQADER
jgi:hypothetical protein